MWGQYAMLTQRFPSMVSHFATAGGAVRRLPADATASVTGALAGGDINDSSPSCNDAAKLQDEELLECSNLAAESFAT
jgi:hypothetical protein